MNNPYYEGEPQVNYGVDLHIVPAGAKQYREAGNFVVTGSGDFGVLSGPLLVMQNRIRELLTPYGSYGRYIEDVTGIKYIDGTYGNPVYFSLSEPQNNLKLQELANACQYIMKKDPRVSEARVVPDINVELGQLLIYVEFTLATGETGTFSFNLQP